MQGKELRQKEDNGYSCCEKKEGPIRLYTTEQSKTGNNE